MHLTIIAKSPVAGRVKTRLVPPCTDAQAAALAEAALVDTIDAVDRAARGRAGVERVLLLDGSPGAWAPTGHEVREQRGEGLADRLANGFDDLGPGVIVGMDTPDACRWLGRALDAVAAGDDVVGLATDGGYWVIGLASVDAAVFDGVPMSESHTGAAQLRRLHGLGRRVRLLPIARDLDDADDLAALAIGGGDGRLPAMARSIAAVLG